MGRTLEKLAESRIDEKVIFNNRMVVEICEDVHVHYRNLRIVLSMSDFISFATGMADSLVRMKKLGMPEPKQGQHIELCRKEVGKFPIHSGQVQVNLNKNLYLENEGKIFAEGAEMYDKEYIHFKLGDLRIELKKDDFLTIADSVSKGKELLCQTK